MTSCLIFMIADYFTYCEMEIRRCFWSGDIYILRTVFHLSISTILISSILFFISDNIFIKWLKFAVIWIVLSIFFISITPEYGRGFLDPDREQISILTGSLFLMISLVLIIVWRIKEGRAK